MIRRMFMGVTLLAVLAATMGGIAMAKSGPLGPGLQEIRAAVASYHSYVEAAADGYSVAQEPCISSPAGAMGFHAVNQGLLASGTVDALRPPILLYVPRSDGSLKLVAVEYLAIALANTESGPAPWFGTEAPPLGFFNPAPSVLGQTFDGPMPGHNPQMPWHYDLHVWVAEANPTGVFAAFNPAISC